MKFIASSTELLSHLQAISRVVSSKNTLPILDNFLFDIAGKTLTLTASDTESTMITSVNLESVEGKGKIALSAKLLLDALKEFSEQPLTFDIDTKTMAVEIISEKGKISINGQAGDDFPLQPQANEEKSSTFNVSASILNTGINKTLFATANDDLRPVMNGILFQLTEAGLTFVASDSHKLVKYHRKDGNQTGVEAQFILPKKPALLLKAILGKEAGDVSVQFDEKNAYFTLPHFKLICRLVEGNYPNYSAVIPQNNPNKMIIDRVEFLNSMKRVSVFSNQASNLAKLHLASNELTVSAQDIDFSISAFEKLNCQFAGDEMEIGFKSLFLIEILANLSAPDIVLELSDASRAGILVPLENNENEEELMLIMPMMINA